MAFIDLTEGWASWKEPIVDIVAVHGLYEAGIRDWTAEETKTIWLRDLFPHREYRARVLFYEYDAKRLAAPGCSASGIYDEAVRLVMELVADRVIQKATRRPIIFICHGFGGVLVKRALAFSNSRRSPKVELDRSILRSTYALLFLATPHHGITKKSLQFSRSEKYGGPSSFMLGLLEGSETLQEIADQFAPLMKHFSIYNLWEQKETNFGPTETLIVDAISAAPPTWSDVDKCGIYATHSGIAKMSSVDSPGYTLILAALDTYISAAPDAISRRWEQDLRILDQERMHEAANLRPISRTEAESNTSVPAPLSSAPSALTSTSRKAMSPQSSPEIPSTNLSPRHINAHYLVQRRSEYFVGRQRQASLLKELLGAEKRRTPGVVVIYGLPGSGKTQFCLKYMEDNRHRYWGVFLIDCSSEANAESSFAALSIHAGKGCEPSAGLEWLAQSSKPWLLVLDNANDSGLDLSRFLPIAGNGHILITTRNPTNKIYGTTGSFRFTGMDPEEAITLLLNLAYPEGGIQATSRTYREPAEIIASELGYLALALKQAAITIRQGFLPLERYLKSLLGCRKALLSRQTISTPVDANIIATWELPFTEITRSTSPSYQDAVDLVHVFAFMHFASIPANVLLRCSQSIRHSKFLRVQPPAIFEPVSTQGVEERVFRAARVLYDHSIISIDNVDAASDDELNKRTSTKYFSLHPAIQQWARERLDEDEQRDWVDCVASILAHSIPSVLETSERPFRRQLLPHISSCLSVLESTYLDLPETIEQASTLERFGSVYAENGLWNRARSLQLKVVKFRDQRLGKRHVDTLNAQRALANTHWNLFEIEQCVNVQRKILLANWWSRPSVFHWLTWRPWKPRHIPYCISLDDLAGSLWLAGQREWSRRAGEGAVDGLTQNLGQDDPLTLNAMFNLARTYLHLGEHKRSYDLLEFVLERRMHFFGPDHPETLMTRNEVGMNLFAQKQRLDEAEGHVHHVLESRKRVLGEEHAYTLWSCNDLSKIYCEVGRSDEAVHILEEIVPVVERTLGESHIGMIMTMSNLSRAYILCKRWKEAGALIRKLRDLVPQNHPDWVHAHWGYAYILVHEGRLDEAESVCSDLLSKISESKVLGPDNQRVLAIAALLLDIFEMQGREDEMSELKDRFPRVEDETVSISIDHMPLGPLRRRRTLGRRATDTQP